MLEIMRKTQYCCLEMLLLRNKVEKCDFLRFFLSQATAGKAIGGGLRAHIGGSRGGMPGVCPPICLAS